MSSNIFKFRDYLWENVENIDYKQPNSPVTFMDVKRQNIINKYPDVAFDIRYFECGPSGFTTLEKHNHSHVVMVIRGQGKIFIENHWIDVNPFDWLIIPQKAVHQLKNNSSSDPFGFICIVNQERDPYRLLTKEEINNLLENTQHENELEIPKGYITNQNKNREKIFNENTRSKII